MWLDLLNQGIEDGYFRPDIDVDVIYRFIRDTTWVSVRWYQPGGPLTAEQVGRQYLSIVLGGITREKESEMTGTSQAYVIEAVRTAVGKRNGSLAGVHPVDLGAAGWRGLLDRVDVDPGAVDDVIAGCVDAIGAQAGNIARLSWLAAGYPGGGPRCHRGSSVRVQSAGDFLWSTGDHVRDRRPDRGGRHAEHEPDPDLLGDDRRPSNSASPHPPTNPRAGCTDTAIRRSRSFADRS